MDDLDNHVKENITNINMRMPKKKEEKQPSHGKRISFKKDDEKDEPAPKEIEVRPPVKVVDPIPLLEPRPPVKVVDPTPEPQPQPPVKVVDPLPPVYPPMPLPEVQPPVTVQPKAEIKPFEAICIKFGVEENNHALTYDASQDNVVPLRSKCPIDHMWIPKPVKGTEHTFYLTSAKNNEALTLYQDKTVNVDPMDHSRNQRWIILDRDAISTKSKMSPTTRTWPF